MKINYKALTQIAMVGLLAGSLSIYSASSTARPGWKTQKVKPTPEQIELQCRYESQIVRGLMSVMHLLVAVTGEIPPESAMISYITNFYDRNKPEESIAAADASNALKWIYRTKPPVEKFREAELNYFQQCISAMSKEDPKAWGNPADKGIAPDPSQPELTF